MSTLLTRVFHNARRLAVVDAHGSWTYAQVSAASRRLADSLRAVLDGPAPAGAGGAAAAPLSTPAFRRPALDEAASESGRARAMVAQPATRKSVGASADTAVGPPWAGTARTAVVLGGGLGEE